MLNANLPILATNVYVTPVTGGKDVVWIAKCVISNYVPATEDVSELMEQKLGVYAMTFLLVN